MVPRDCKQCKSDRTSQHCTCTLPRNQVHVGVYIPGCHLHCIVLVLVFFCQ